MHVVCQNPDRDRAATFRMQYHFPTKSSTFLSLVLSGTHPTNVGRSLKWCTSEFWLANCISGSLTPKLELSTPRKSGQAHHLHLKVEEKRSPAEKWKSCKTQKTGISSKLLWCSWGFPFWDGGGGEENNWAVSGQPPHIQRVLYTQTRLETSWPGHCSRGVR